MGPDFYVGTDNRLSSAESQSHRQQNGGETMAPDILREGRQHPVEPKLGRDLSSLSGDEPVIVLRMGENFDTVLQGAIEGIGQSNGEKRGQQIDIDLQIAM